jgi:hypothetical protein
MGEKKGSQRFQQLIGRKEYSFKGCGKALGRGIRLWQIDFCNLHWKKKRRFQRSWVRFDFKGCSNALVFKGCRNTKKKKSSLCINFWRLHQHKRKYPNFFF